jgi:hypothetical protein
VRRFSLDIDSSMRNDVDSSRPNRWEGYTLPISIDDLDEEQNDPAGRYAKNPYLL